MGFLHSLHTPFPGGIPWRWSLAGQNLTDLRLKLTGWRSSLAGRNLTSQSPGLAGQIEPRGSEPRWSTKLTATGAWVNGARGCGLGRLHEGVQKGPSSVSRDVSAAVED